MPALPAGSPDAQMAIVHTGTLGYGVNKRRPPYLPEKGKRRSGVRKAEEEHKDPIFDTGNAVRERG